MSAIFAGRAERASSLQWQARGATAGAELVWDRLGSGRVAALDAIRAIACGVVVLDHLEMAGPLAGVGLPVFLLLSGFLITSMLLREGDRTGTISTRGFLVRRAMRLMPGLYAYLSFATILLLVGGVRVNWAHLFATALHVGNYYEAIHGPQESYVSHAWSLGLQEQFYLLWPAVLLWLRNDLRKLTRWTIVAILAVWVARLSMVAVGVNQSYIYRAFETRIDHILIGCLLAVAVRRRVFAPLFSLMTRGPRAALAVALGILGASLLLQERFGAPYRDTVGFIVDPICIALLVVMAVTFSDRPAWRWTSWRWLSWLGTVSYGLYLYHPLAISTVRHFAPGAGPLALPAVLALSVVAAAASFYAIERPFMRQRTTPVRRTRVSTGGWAATIGRAVDSLALRPTMGLAPLPVAARTSRAGI